jgi:1,4-dihydroxy-2-naphthoyl-CoA hydrolase
LHNGLPTSGGAFLTEHDRHHARLPEWLGFHILEAGPDLARAELTVAPGVIQSGGVVHGGVLFTLADSVAANLAMANAPEASGATIDASIRFFRPARSGVLTATARLLHRGRRTLGIEVHITDGAGQLVAVYQSSFLAGS